MVAKKCQLSRRRFLGGAAGGLVAPYFISSRVLGAAGQPPPSDRVVAAVIGCGGRGMGLLSIHNDPRLHHRRGVRRGPAADGRGQEARSGRATPTRTSAASWTARTSTRC